MSFKIKPSRKRTFEFVDGEDKLTVTFDFVCTEDIKSSEVIKRLKEGVADQDSATQFMWYTIRRSLIECTGIDDIDTGMSIALKDKDGKINDDIQRAIFEFIIGLGDMRSQIIDAYIGPTSKNSKPGVTQL